jgi:hypothetical protein
MKTLNRHIYNNKKSKLKKKKIFHKVFICIHALQTFEIFFSLNLKTKKFLYQTENRKITIHSIFPPKSICIETKFCKLFLPSINMNMI